MTATVAWGCAAAALLVVLGMMAGWPLGYRRGLRDGEEEAGWREQDRRWKRAEALTEPGTTLPARPEAPRDGRGRHRHPPGPARHEAGPQQAARAVVPPALPVAGYLPAPDPGPWNGTITMPAPVQTAPWDVLPPEPEQDPEPAVVLEPTKVLPPPDPCSDSAWTRRMAEDMDAWIAEHISGTDSTLKAITGGAS